MTVMRSHVFFARTRQTKNGQIPTLQEAHLSNGNAVQIIGKVNPDLSVRVLSSLDLGTGVGTSSLPAANPSPDAGRGLVFLIRQPMQPCSI